jgi:DNA-binding SARP family transcriptional activator
VQLRILGPLQVWRTGTEVDAGPPQQQCLLALLLAREGHPVSTAELIELLWGPASPPSAVNVIHKYVGALRRLLEPGLPARAPGAYLARRGTGYRFTAGLETLDLVRFRRLIAAAQAQAGRDEHDQALDGYIEALRLDHGRAGGGLARTTAAQATFASLDDEFVEAVLDAAQIAARLRRPARLVAPLRHAADLNPLNEPVQASLVTTLAAAGRRAEALTAYRVIRERLSDELGVDPGPDLREAYRGVMSQAAPSGRARGRTRPCTRLSRRPASRACSS